MNIFLRLLEKKRSADQLSAVSYQPSSLGSWLPTNCLRLLNTYYLTPFILLVFFVSCSAALAQEFDVHAAPAALAVSETNALGRDQPEITALKIGDRIPDELWEMHFPVVSANIDQVQYLSLGDFRDKLIILDFWATWCAPCISSLHKLDTLQVQFKDDLMVIPTSYEPESKVKPFLTKREIDLPSLIDQEDLREYFPHRSVPHQVWIKGNEVIAKVGPEYTNYANIEQAVNNKELKMFMEEEDIDFDIDRPLFYDGNGGDVKNIAIRSVIAPRINAEIAGVDRGANRLLLYNVFASNLIYESVSDIIPSPGRYNRIIWDVSDSLKNDLTGEAKDLTGDYEQDIAFLKWREENTYCYELAVNPNLDFNRKDLRSIMRAELQKFFNLTKGIAFEIETKVVPSYSIIETGKKKITENLFEAEDPNQYFTLINQPFEKLHRYVSAVLAKEEIPFASLSNFNGSVSIQLDKNHLTAKGIRSQLNKFGYDLTVSPHELKMLVISNLKKED